GRQNPEAMQAAIDEGKITGEQFDRAVDGTPRAFFETLLEDITGTKEQLVTLEKTVDEKFGRSAPSLIKLRSAIDDCFEVVSGIVKKKRSQDPGYKAESEESSFSAAEDQALSTGGGAAVAPPGANWAGEPRSREEAFQRLRVISAYLRRVEPQHPVTYLLERTVKWTQMPLEDWLAEVINSPDALQNLRQTLGIKEPDNA
ncbi:MAG TPA: hypothetical protein VLA17_15065, partial [Candidatus Limnocylindria bacterium]|nr:hypothetical protein [Candidatus Limnocylindria bacterium]